ncbi:MAG: (cytosine-5)-methyltransferase 1 [Chloroflexota bacterium]|nr:(cytosine-5)-methyltransferase 1 [Chloroflexota bacterium]
MNIKNRYSVLDLFAGAGGFGLGFNLSGYSIKYSLEIDQWAVETLRNNNPKTIVIHEDIRAFNDSSEILSAVNNENFDVIIGGPPCQGFSVANPKKDSKDPRNSLFTNFVKWVSVLRPKVFVMENVKGILSRRNLSNEKVIDIIQNSFNDLGYSVDIWILNSVEYGVPQYRERVFIVGNSLKKQIIEPTPIFDKEKLEELISVGDAILDLPILNAGEGSNISDYTKDPASDYQKWARGNQNVLFNHEAMKHTKRIVERFNQIQWGESPHNIPSEYHAKKRNGNGEKSKVIYNMNNRRLDPRKPSYTIPASFYSSFIHPYQNRNLTAREAARIQSFPDYYHFFGKRTMVSSKLLQKNNRLDENHLSQYNQIGNAVPPLLAKFIANQIKIFLDGNKL